jgi:hypothetical protein
MTVSMLLAITGGLGNHAYEHRMLQAADRWARENIEQRLGALMTESGEHFGAFDGIASEVDGEEAQKKHHEALRRADDLCDAAERTMTAPSDAACDLYTPKMSAAYYYGLAVGLRLAGGNQRRRSSAATCSVGS